MYALTDKSRHGKRSRDTSPDIGLTSGPGLVGGGYGYSTITDNQGARAIPKSALKDTWMCSHGALKSGQKKVGATSFARLYNTVKDRSIES